MKQKNKRKKEHGLLWQMIAAMLATLVPLAIVISFLFAKSTNTMQQSWDSTQKNNTQIIASRIDNYIQGIYSASDAFATNSKMRECIEKIYTDQTQKLLAIQYIQNRFFTFYNQLQDNPQISVIYNNQNDQVFNLLDPLQDDELVKQRLEEMQVNSPKKLSKFFWYPLQDNPFQRERYHDFRRDRVIVGSRRIYSSAMMQYPYVHIFAIPEKALFELYREIAQETNGEVYIMDSQGMLLSSSQKFVVQTGVMPDHLQKWLAASKEGSSESFSDKEHSYYQWESELNGWKTIVVVPRSAMFNQMNSLYKNVLWAIGIAVVVAVGSIMRLYSQFTAPLSKVAKAMQEVDSGNWNAYVQPAGGQQISEMMETYNHMLESMNRSVDARLELERKKKELEMQVLMTQINPHFLYNTLETIVWRAGEAGRTDIGRLAASLGKMYRLSISGGIIVPLRQELSHLQAYINIQQSRYKDMVEYRQIVTPGLLDTGKIIKLTLQPIVENSILYAMEEMQHPIIIRVKVYQRGNKMIVRITDTGLGMGKEQLWKLRHRLELKEAPSQPQNRRSTGIGLWNIVQRMKIYLGAESEFKILSKKKWGTCVQMTFPQKNLPESKE